jgi:hypothetical protein
MPFDLSLPLFAATGLALAAIVTYVGLPHIRLRTYNKTHGDLRVIEVALMLSRSPVRSFLSAAPSNNGKSADQAPGAEFVIYMTLKTGNL